MARGGIDCRGLAVDSFRERRAGWGIGRPNVLSCRGNPVTLPASERQDRYAAAFKGALGLRRLPGAARAGVLISDSGVRSRVVRVCCCLGFADTPSLLNPSRRIHSVNLRDFYATDLIKNTAYWSVDDFPAELNDGIDLLRANVRPGDGVTTVAYVDPFSVALGMPPADDGPRWWDLNISFNRTHAPSAEEFLGHVSLVMVPRLTNRGEGMLLCYGRSDARDVRRRTLQSHFHEAASTDAWILYRRNADGVRRHNRSDRKPTPDGQSTINHNMNWKN